MLAGYSLIPSTTSETTGNSQGHRGTTNFPRKVVLCVNRFISLARTENCENREVMGRKTKTCQDIHYRRILQENCYLMIFFHSFEKQMKFYHTQAVGEAVG